MVVLYRDWAQEVYNVRWRFSLWKGEWRWLRCSNKFQEREIIGWSGWMRGIRGHFKSSIMDADEEWWGNRWEVLILLEVNMWKWMCVSETAQLTGHSPPHTYPDSLLEYVGISLLCFRLRVSLCLLIFCPDIFCTSTGRNIFCFLKICSRMLFLFFSKNQKCMWMDIQFKKVQHGHNVTIKMVWSWLTEKICV